MIVALLTAGGVVAFCFLLWLLYGVYLAERHPSEAERLIRATGEGFPIQWRRRERSGRPR